MKDGINHDTNLVIDSLADYAIFTTDEEGSITTWSSGAERMGALISAMLDTTRITTGKLVLNQEAINLCGLVNEIF